MSDSIRELVPVFEMKEMGDIPSEATSSPQKNDEVRGRHLTEQDQKERWQYLQGKHETSSGSTDSNYHLKGRGEQQETVTQERLPGGSVRAGIQSTVTYSSDCNAWTSEVLDENKNLLARPPSSGNVFSLNSDDSSFIVSEVPTVVADGVTNQVARSDQIGSALPLSSKVSEGLSKLSVSSEVTTKPDSGSCYRGNHVSLSATKQEAVNVRSGFSGDGKLPQCGTGDCRNNETENDGSLKNGFLPLSSRGEGTHSTGEGDIDEDEVCDILILFHENDEPHLSRFQDICEEYKWTTRTKDDFPLGELGFKQLDEELDKCLLVVALISANFLENGVNSHEHHTALMKSIKEKSKNFIPVVCESGLQLPSYLETMTVGDLDKKSFKKQLKATVNKAKKKRESSRNSLPLNNLDTHQTGGQGQQQGPRSCNPSGSAPDIFRRLQGDLSPGPYAQRVFSDETFRELCLVLDLTDSLGTPYWHKLAEFIGLTQQDIIWLHQHGRCAANVLEVYFCRRSGEVPSVVLRGLMNVLDKELNHLQAAGIVREELTRVAATVSSHHR